LCISFCIKLALWRLSFLLVISQHPPLHIPILLPRTEFILQVVLLLKRDTNTPKHILVDAVRRIATEKCRPLDFTSGFFNMVEYADVVPAHWSCLKNSRSLWQFLFNFRKN